MDTPVARRDRGGIITQPARAKGRARRLLHAMDAILFRGLIGPIRLNWILDLGLSLTVCVSAILFGRNLRQKIDGRG